jgi:hypothetical protein
MDIKVDACSSDAIIKNHDGWISVDSELGKGATDRIFLPANEAKLKTKEDFNRSGLGIRAVAYLWWFGVLYLATTFLGCASATKKFTPTTQTNISTFADTTIAMLSNAKLGFERDEILYLKEFFAVGEVEEKRLLELKERFVDTIRGLLNYSLELVVIFETNNNEADRVAAYADYVSALNDKALENLGFEINDLPAQLFKLGTDTIF